MLGLLYRFFNAIMSYTPLMMCCFRTALIRQVLDMNLLRSAGVLPSLYLIPAKTNACRCYKEKMVK